MKAKEKRLRRKARLARNSTFAVRQAEIDKAFAELGDAMFDCDGGEVGNCAACQIDIRFEAAYAAATRAVNHWTVEDGEHRKQV